MNTYILSVTGCFFLYTLKTVLPVFWPKRGRMVRSTTAALKSTAFSLQALQAFSRMIWGDSSFAQLIDLKTARTVSASTCTQIPVAVLPLLGPPEWLHKTYAIYKFNLEGDSGSPPLRSSHQLLFFNCVLYHLSINMLVFRDHKFLNGVVSNWILLAKYQQFWCTRI